MLILLKRTQNTLFHGFEAVGNMYIIHPMIRSHASRYTYEQTCMFAGPYLLIQSVMFWSQNQSVTLSWISVQLYRSMISVLSCVNFTYSTLWCTEQSVFRYREGDWASMVYSYQGLLEHQETTDARFHNWSTEMGPNYGTISWWRVDGWLSIQTQIMVLVEEASDIPAIGKYISKRAAPVIILLSS